MSGPRILLIVGGGIAAYKACELVRLIRKGQGDVTCVLTEGGAKFVTPLSLAALSENPVHTTLWDLKNEVEMGHIQLSRAADLIVVCPATANLLAKMTAGIADDLATTLLLATDKPVLAVPAMNVKMWQHAATMRNIATLQAAGVVVMQPDEGAMACGEFGPGRLPEPFAVWHQIAQLLGLDLSEEPSLFSPDERGGEGEQESDDTSLGGLARSLISRSKKRSEPLPDLSVESELAEVPSELPLDEAPLAPLDLGGPVLARKGKAKSAPPTDPEAINHLVAAKQGAAPEPIEGDKFAISVGSASGPAEPRADANDFAFDPDYQPLLGRHILVTAGPTHEPIDPVRYIANRSSGKQGYAIAGAAAAAGAQVTLISGPVNLATPRGVERVNVETARQMADAVKKALPADVAIMVAAVADWRTTDSYGEKIKKRGSAPPALMLTENPDILASVSAGKHRPGLLIGFAAETQDVLDNATEKRKRKGVDWIVANDVSDRGKKSVMGGDANVVHIITASAIESLPEMSKADVARALVERIANALSK
ncbi:MAG: bifunctional phosphopantothenoylcysteine decarboxylase/phosphopantothenate synthase [Novosphingobium sp.]